tara:strand:+ start:135 stop:1031 length:897 start_codon:yes stop_codon:yes gene_type:complete
MKKLLLLSALLIFANSDKLLAQDYMEMSKKKLRIEHQIKLDELNNNINEKDLLKVKVDSLNRQVLFLDSNFNKVQVDLQLAIENSNKMAKNIDSMKNRIKELEIELSDSNKIVSDLQTVYQDRNHWETIYDELRNSRNFETFLSYFLLTAYSEQSIDNLTANSLPWIMEFTNSNIQFGRFYNPGAVCQFYYVPVDENHSFNNNNPILTFYENQKPEGGRCEEASSPNGIYYSQVNDLPEGLDTSTSEWRRIPTPYYLRNLKKMEVNIQEGEWITTILYFVEYKNKWVLLYKYDCDCGA